MRKTPLFTAFIEQAIPNAEERAYARSLLAAWAKGAPRRPIVLFGAGATGKTTLERVLLAAVAPATRPGLSTANDEFRVAGLDVDVIRLYHVVPLQEMDIRLMQKIVRDELRGVREWLEI
jgi:hypothetical protein